MRNVSDYKVTTEGRDFGKTYRLTEMSAADAEWWAVRLFLALARGGADIPDSLVRTGMAGVAELTFKAFAYCKAEDAKPLLDEMMACVQFVPSPAAPTVAYALGVNQDDIENAETRFTLRYEVLKLHTGFSMAADFFMSILRAAARDTSPIPMSPPPSE